MSDFFGSFYNALGTYPSMKSIFNFWDVLLCFLVPALLMIPLTFVYKRTHKGVTYNQAFTHTMYMMSVTTAIIMMIIGGNIARAFSLVGALSIIRFRTAVKDSRDTGYIFGAIAIGMAAGTGMYFVAVQFTALLCILLLVLNYYRVGEKVVSDKMLKVHFGKDLKEEDLQKTLIEHVNTYSLVHSECINEDGDQSQTYIISTASDGNDTKLLEAIRSKHSLKSSSIFYNDQRIEI